MPAHDAEHDRQGDRLLLGARAHAHERGRAGVGQRQHGEDEEHGDGVAPVHAEDQAPDHQQPDALHGGDAQAGGDQRSHDRSPPHRRGGQPVHQSEPARLDHARGEEEHGDAEEEDEVGRRDVGERAERSRHVGVGERHVGHARVGALGGDEVEQRHHVRARLDSAGRGRLAHEVDALRPRRRREADEPGHHAAPENVVAQLGPVGLDPHLEVAGAGHQMDEAGGGVHEPDGLLGAPGQQAGDEDEEDREHRGDEQVAPVADGAAQVDPDDRDHGVTIRRTRTMARRPGDERR